MSITNLMYLVVCLNEDRQAEVLLHVGKTIPEITHEFTKLYPKATDVKVFKEATLECENYYKQLKLKELLFQS